MNQKQKKKWEMPPKQKKWKKMPPSSSQKTLQLPDQNFLSFHFLSRQSFALLANCNIFIPISTRIAHQISSNTKSRQFTRIASTVFEGVALLWEIISLPSEKIIKFLGDSSTLRNIAHQFWRMTLFQTAKLKAAIYSELY